MKKAAFTLTEAVIAMFILGIIVTTMITTIKKSDYVNNALKTAGKNSLLQISYATSQILAKYSTNYQMTKLLTLTKVQFSINDSGADQKIVLLYKKMLKESSKTADTTYTNLVLRNEAGETIGEGTGLKVSDFTQGFISRNDTYIAFKLYDNCTSDETYIYDPAAIEKREVSNSCGLIFFDVNAFGAPNVLGIDQYIVSIGKFGIK